MFSLGVSMELPKGYEALCVPRSSTFRKYGVILVNSVGVIDETFCGDEDVWQFLAYAMRDTVIPKNERICQVCGKTFDRDEMLLTRDCFGIPYRFVCPDCYDKCMEKGFDGEEYTEADECIDEDW